MNETLPGIEHLSLRPYVKIKDESYPQEITILLKKDNFLDVEYKDGNTTFIFINCLFKKMKIENFEDIGFRDISFSFTGCYIENITIDQITSKNISVAFLSSYVGGKVENNNLVSVLFNNCIIRSIFVLSKLSKISVSFTEENIFPIRWQTLFKRISIENWLNLIKQRQSYYIEDCKVLDFYVKEKEHVKRGIYRNHYETEERVGYYLTVKEKQQFSVNLTLKYSLGYEDTETRINNAHLTSFSLSGSPVGKIIVENTRIGSWFIRDFSPKGEVKCFNISKILNDEFQGKIEIHNSNLDNVWFDNTNFNDFSVVSFYRTKFSETIFTSCNFPQSYLDFQKFTSLENIHLPEQKSDNYHKDQYEIFLQLKMSLEATGNFYEAQKLQAISNEALVKITSVKFWDKFILWVNSKSNNHGLSIKLPFLWFASTSIVLYLMYLLSLNRVFNGNDIDPALIGYYFSFVDLTHRADFLVDKNEFNFWSLMIDYFNKITTGFFIYQFIAAFRKYGKT